MYIGDRIQLEICLRYNRDISWCMLFCKEGPFKVIACLNGHNGKFHQYIIIGRTGSNLNYIIFSKCNKIISERSGYMWVYKPINAGTKLLSLGQLSHQPPKNILAAGYLEIMRHVGDLSQKQMNGGQQKHPKEIAICLSQWVLVRRYCVPLLIQGRFHF